MSPALLPPMLSGLRGAGQGGPGGVPGGEGDLGARIAIRPWSHSRNGRTDLFESSSQRKARPKVAPARPVAPAGPRVGWMNAVSATVTGMGYELVDVERAQRGLLRVYIDRVPGHVYAAHAAAPLADDMSHSVTVDDCEAVTRQLQYALEVEGLDYARLEVSSPGLDRPLRREADYERFAGHTVSVQLKVPFEGRKSWQGVLSAGEAGAWTLAFMQGKQAQSLGFRLDEVREARLVPQVDFKGRKSRDGGSAGAAAAEPPVDGG